MTHLMSWLLLFHLSPKMTDYPLRKAKPFYLPSPPSSPLLFSSLLFSATAYCLALP